MDHFLRVGERSVERGARERKRAGEQKELGDGAS